MASYRLYCLDKGQVRPGDDFEADSDSAAVAIARARVEAGACELWCQGRLVAMFPNGGGDPIILTWSR